MTIRALPARQLMGRALIAASLAFSGTAVLPGAPAAAAGSVTYVDCSRATAGDGSQTAPFNSVGQANGKTYGPGDTLAFASGTTCTGALAPRGSGTAAAPIALTAYGTGALPVIDGAGAPDTVSLTNQDHWRISNLKLTNPASTVARRTGLRISATDGTAHRGYDIGNLVIDRVVGQGRSVVATGRRVVPGTDGQDLRFVDVFTIADDGMVLSCTRYHHVAP